MEQYQASVDIRCPDCHAALRLPSSSNALKLRCRSCGHVFILRPDGRVADAPPPAASHRDASRQLLRIGLPIAFVAAVVVLGVMTFLAIRSLSPTQESTPEVAANTATGGGIAEVGMASPVQAPSLSDDPSVTQQSEPGDPLARLQSDAEAGDAEAQYELARKYKDDGGVAQDAEEAVTWYRRAADQGHTLAQYNLAVMYDTGEGLPENDAEAVKWYRRAAEQGHATAQFNLAVMHHSGEGVAVDFFKAMTWYFRAAEQGHADAQYTLGLIFAHAQHAIGERVGEKVGELWRYLYWGDSKAVKWFRRAAEQGHADAQYTLGLMIADMQNAVENEVEMVWAWDFISRATVDRDGATTYGRASYIVFIDGGMEGNAMAMRWFRRAAEQGHAEAQLILGAMYDFGRGVETNDQEAAKWYRRAAEQGEAVAQCNLAEMYDTGEGAAKDFTEGAKWYRRAAQQGNTAAQFNLGLKYDSGEGVVRDVVRAYAWWNIAAAAGLKQAARSRESIARQMTPQQIAEAQRLSRKFKPQPEVVNSAERDDRFSPPPEARIPKGSGSGFFITSHGHFLTNHHVVQDAASITIRKGDKKWAARVIRTDRANDLALLKVEGRTPALPLKAAGVGVLVGQTVATIGFPNPGLQGQSPKFNSGQISSLSGPMDNASLLQISTPVQPGNSGGPLLDEEGHVVGVVLAKLSVKAAFETSGALPENVNYAIKGSVLWSFLESVPGLAERLPKPQGGKTLEPEDVAKSATECVGMVKVYGQPRGGLLD